MRAAKYQIYQCPASPRIFQSSWNNCQVKWIISPGTRNFLAFITQQNYFPWLKFCLDHVAALSLPPWIINFKSCLLVIETFFFFFLVTESSLRVISSCILSSNSLGEMRARFSISSALIPKLYICDVNTDRVGCSLSQQSLLQVRNSLTGPWMSHLLTCRAKEDSKSKSEYDQGRGLVLERLCRNLIIWNFYPRTNTPKQ